MPLRGSDENYSVVAASLSDTASMKTGLNLTLGPVQQIVFLMLSYPLGALCSHSMESSKLGKGPHGAQH